MTPQQQAVIDIAMTWLKTPWHHMARVRGAGVDCAQILIAVFAEAGLVDEFDPGYYPPDWMMHREEERFLGWIGQYARRVDFPEPGDVAIYTVGRCFSHSAIVVDWPSIIHASNHDHMVCLADGTQGWLAGRDVQFWRVNGVDA